MPAADLPDDETLTHNGLVPLPKGRVLVIACGAIAREVIAVLKANRMDHVDLHCLPAILHNHPDKIEGCVRKAVAQARDQYETIFLGYADCGTGGLLEKAAGELGITMLPGAHCYAFFEGVDAFNARTQDNFTAFYLTDFLTRQFDAFVWKPLGLDRHPELGDAYFGNYETLVYQSQTQDADLLAKAEDCAKRLGLSFRHIHTGMGDLEKAISQL